MSHCNCPSEIVFNVGCASACIPAPNVLTQMMIADHTMGHLAMVEERRLWRERLKDLAPVEVRLIKGTWITVDETGHDNWTKK